MRLIVEADGGSRGNPGPAAYGALVRNADTGEVLSEVSEAIGVATNNVAEYRGVIAGLAEARRIDPDATVEARLDSKLIVEQMSGRWKIKNPDLKPLALDLRRIFPADRVTYSWVPREQNTHADGLVNEALDGEPSRAPATSVEATATPVAVDREPSRAPATSVVATATPVAVDRAPRLFLVRHGQTADTVARLFAGGSSEGAPLDELGRQQADNAAALLAETGAAAIACSPMLRARQTAAPIADRLGLEVHVDPDWREVEFGEWEGRPIEEVIATDPDRALAWRESTAARTPGGESINDMAERVDAARDRLLAKYDGESVVAVTHSMPIRALVAATLGAPMNAIHYLRPGTGSVTELRLGHDGLVLTGFSLM